MDNLSKTGAVGAPDGISIIFCSLLKVTVASIARDNMRGVNGWIPYRSSIFFLTEMKRPTVM